MSDDLDPDLFDEEFDFDDEDIEELDLDEEDLDDLEDAFLEDED
jgi:hypothetical protein